MWHSENKFEEHFTRLAVPLLLVSGRKLLNISSVCSPEDLLFPGVEWTAMPEFTDDGKGVYSFPGGNVTYNGVYVGSTATYRTSKDHLINGVRILERRCKINTMWTAPDLIISNASESNAPHRNVWGKCYDYNYVEPSFI